MPNASRCAICQPEAPTSPAVRRAHLDGPGGLRLAEYLQECTPLSVAHEPDA